MTTENLGQLMLSALGKGNKDDEVRKAFAEASLANWPDVADDREAAWNVEYWRYGCSLTFVETGQYEQLFDEHGIQGGLVAVASTFYLRGVDGFRAFPEDPPFGLTPGMKPDEVAACIGPVRASRVPYDRRVDLFFVDDYAVNVFYDHSDEEILLVEIRKKSIYERGLTPDPGIHWQSYTNVLGKKCGDPETLAEIGGALGVPILASELEQSECDQYRRSHGLTFYSAKYKDIRQDFGGGSAPDGKERLLVGVKFQRAGDFESKGYRGLLPFGLTFTDPPDQILSKVPVAPREASEEEGSGYYGIEHEGCYYHIYYSLIFWQILAVSVFDARYALDHKL